jgi:dihydroxyacid dehydratase/phosphogluconate dehydratase
MVKPNIAIVSSYNDMLSAHKPFESYPARLKQAVIEAGGIAQFAAVLRPCVTASPKAARACSCHCSPET